MSKLIQYLVAPHQPDANSPLVLPGEHALALEAHRLYVVAAEQMRQQRQGFSQAYHATQEAIATGVAARVSRELRTVHLIHPQHYALIGHALIQWRQAPTDYLRECQAVKDALAACLPAARQTQRLRVLCRQYQRHLIADIKSELRSEYPAAFHRYRTYRCIQNGSGPSPQPKATVSSAAALDRLITEDLARYAIPADSTIHQAIQKYAAIKVLHRTLTTFKPAPAQVQDFQQALAQQRPVIERHRDSTAMRFLKGVATVLTLGMAALCGIWNVRGRSAASRMTAVLADKPLASAEARCG